MAQHRDTATTPTTMSRSKYRLVINIVLFLFILQLVYALVFFKGFDLTPGLKTFGAHLNPPPPRDTSNGFQRVSAASFRPTPRHFRNRSSASPMETSFENVTWTKTNDTNVTVNAYHVGMVTEPSHNDMMKHVISVLSLPWKPNQTFIEEFKCRPEKSALDSIFCFTNQYNTLNEESVVLDKNQMDSFVNTHSLFILSQKSVKSGEALHFAHNRDRNQVISDHLHKSLPKECPFTNTSFKRCSVIGSSGVLRSSGCGQEIDKADYIFRCNSPPTEEFSADAGGTTNITTLNLSLVRNRFHNLHSSSDKTKFLRAMQANHAAILIPLFGIKSAYSMGQNILRAMRTAKNPSLETLIAHPKHFVRIQDFWKTKGIKDRLSTGFYLVSVALALCDNVHLYGFWPFPQDIYQNNVTYHYYNDEEITANVHDFPLEFEKLLQLHHEGMINLHVRPCTSTTNVGREMTLSSV